MILKWLRIIRMLTFGFLYYFKLFLLDDFFKVGASKPAAIIWRGKSGVTRSRGHSPPNALQQVRNLSLEFIAYVTYTRNFFLGILRAQIIEIPISLFETGRIFSYGNRFFVLVEICLIRMQKWIIKILKLAKNKSN